MTELEVKAGQVEGGSQSIVHNLDFIPEGKLNWKPSESSKSVLEIVNHLVGNLKGATGGLRTGEWDVDYKPAQTLEDAKKAVSENGAAFAAQLRAMTAEQLQETVSLPPGPFPKGAIVDIGVFEVMHHHGQIAYLQTLWGDTDDHLIFFGD